MNLFSNTSQCLTYIRIGTASIECGFGVSKMVRLVKAPATKPEDLEFYSWNPCGGKREPTPTGCPLPSTLGAGVREMIQGVECLPPKYEDLNSDAQQVCKVMPGPAAIPQWIKTLSHLTIQILSPTLTCWSKITDPTDGPLTSK